MATFTSTMPVNGENRHDNNCDLVINNEATSFSRVLIIGAGAVGCLTACKLGRAGIDVTIIEKLPMTSDSPRACGYYGAVHFMLNELGLYELIRKEGFLTRGLCWRKRPTN